MQEILCGSRYLSGDDTLRVFAAGGLTNNLAIEVLWRSGRNSRVTGVRANRVYVIDEPAENEPNPSLEMAEKKSAPSEPLFKDVSHWINQVHHEELFNDYARQPLLMKLLSQLGPGVAWLDLDGDGYPELILACEWGPIKVFKNERGHLRDATVELGLAPLTGRWNGVTTGDFDEDGRMDIIASNWGLNTGYQASPEHPVELYFGDLAGAGIVDLVEACFAPELKAVVPRRSLNALSQAFPWLAERYPTLEAFSTATVVDLGRVFRAPPQQAGAATFLYENAGARPGFRVRLKGPPGNPLGIGAIIRLQFGPRLGPAREVHAGSGYWSQDSLVQVCGCPEPPTKVHVLWPGGKRQMDDIPEGARQVVVEINRRQP